MLSATAQNHVLVFLNNQSSAGVSNIVLKIISDVFA
jgi:hypothetical protein